MDVIHCTHYSPKCTMNPCIRIYIYIYVERWYSKYTFSLIYYVTIEGIGSEIH